MDKNELFCVDLSLYSPRPVRFEIWRPFKFKIAWLGFVIFLGRKLEY